MYKHILLPTDGSELSQSAVEYGISLAKSVGAKVTGVAVTEPFHMLAADAAIGTARITGKAIGAAADAVIPGSSD